LADRRYGVFLQKISKKRDILQYLCRLFVFPGVILGEKLEIDLYGFQSFLRKIHPHTP